MPRRLLLGLTEGLVIGLALGVACARGLGLGAPGTVVALGLGAVAGFVIGLVAGRPIWARNAKTEAILKAAAGAVGGVLLSLAVRRWLNFALDLRAFSLGAGPAGQLSIVMLPAVATALAVFFELDDDGPRSPDGASVKAGARQRVQISNADSDSTSADDSELFDDEVEHKVEKH
jgi:hypothetical protein